MKVFTKFEDLPADLRKPDSDVKFEDGWITLPAEERVHLPLPGSLKGNYGVRTKGHFNNKLALALRDQVADTSHLKLFYSPTWQKLTAQCITKSEAIGVFAIAVPAEMSASVSMSLEFAVVGSRLIGRLNDSLVGMGADSHYPTGSGYLEGIGRIRDIEVINLDGLSEAEALKILGVDEKGNDLRAAAVAQEKQAMEQAKVVDAASAIPELKALHEQFAKLTAERVTAPFEADVAKLNAGYVGGIDREIANEKKAGHLDGVIALEAEKKLIQGVGTSLSPPTRDQDGPSPSPIPAEVDAATTEAIKKLRGIYRAAYAKIEAARAENLKDLTDPLSIRLKQLEATLTQKDRIAHAKTVREYAEALDGSKAGLGAVDASTPPVPNTPTGVSKAPSAAKLNQREVLDWLLSLGANVVVKDGASVKTIKSGDKIPSGKIVILRIEHADPNQRWNVTDDDFGKLAGLTELTKLDFAICVNVTGSGLALLGALPELDHLDMSFGSFDPANFAIMPDFPKLRAIVSLPPPQFAAADFARLPPLKALRTINGGNHINDETLPAICAHSKLTALTMPNNCLTDDGLAALAQLKDLEVLGINGNQNTRITGTGLIHLTALPKLRDLTVGNSPVFEAKNAALLSDLKSLTTLRISGGGDLKDKEEWIKHLGALKASKLTKLTLSPAVGFTAEQVAALKKALPKVDVKVE